jgi:hypothetical protein
MFDKVTLYSSNIAMLFFWILLFSLSAFGYRPIIVFHNFQSSYLTGIPKLLIKVHFLPLVSISVRNQDSDKAVQRLLWFMHSFKTDSKFGVSAINSISQVHKVEVYSIFISNTTKILHFLTQLNRFSALGAAFVSTPKMMESIMRCGFNNKVPLMLGIQTVKGS